MDSEVKQPVKVVIRENGSILIEQDVEIHFPDGRVEHKQGRVTLCRCGQSEKKPYCDGKHKTIIWDSALYEIEKLK